jgi:hypothetical protein
LIRLLQKEKCFMKTTRFQTMQIALAVLTLIAASLACQMPTPVAPPTATQDSDPSPTITPIPPTAEEGVNLVITNVTLDTTTPSAGEWVTVDVTIENQGGEMAAGYELVLIPHYGWGPPNPAGHEVLPDLAPGATHTVAFSPGVLYTDPGTFTLRVLVTDDWYASGDPDSTGTAGDYQDFLITVIEPVTFEANLVITNVTLNTTTPSADEWVTVDVTIENQGGAAAAGYDLVLIPHYGWGPPNPAGYKALPDLVPGATHTVSFSPGVLYTDPGTFTLRVLVTDDWYASGSPDSTGTAGDYQDFLITVTEPVTLKPNLVITNVTLDTTTPPVGGWVVVDVTIENLGGAVETGYELVLIPHYGWGPPNPAGYELLPDLAPGAIYTKSFSPGVLYSTAGTFTLRVLVTDDWYASGNPDSTGTAGDYHDILITVGGG